MKKFNKNRYIAHSVGMAAGLAALLATQIATVWAINNWLIL